MTTLQEHLEALQLSEDDQDDFDTIKQAFFKKITSPFILRPDRIKYNLAFEYLCNRIFDVEESSAEKKIIEAIYKGDIEYLKKKLTKEGQTSSKVIKSSDGRFNVSLPILNYRKKGTNYPLIYLAVRSGHYDVVELILKSGCSLDFSKDRSTPMHCAAYYGYEHLIPLLFKYGIPTNVKNYADHIPEQEAYRESIITLLRSSQKDIYFSLIQKLNDEKLVLGTLNTFLRKKQSKQKESNYDIRKIILKGYFDYEKDYVDAFHGTKFDVLDSIAKHGLRAAGEKVNGVTLVPEDGHIGLGVEVNGHKNWGKAIFVSPSIYYAADPCYSKAVLIDGEPYCPVVQTKVKKGTYTSHNHTTFGYELKDKEPVVTEFRVQCKVDSEKDNIYRSQDNKNVKVIAIMLIRQRFLAQNENYNEMTNFVLNSNQEQIFKLKKPKP